MSNETIEAISLFLDIEKSKIEKILLFNEQISSNKEKYENLVLAYNDFIIASYYDVDSIKMMAGPDRRIYINIYDEELNKIGCINSISNKKIRIIPPDKNKDLYINIYDDLNK